MSHTTEDSELALFRDNVGRFLDAEILADYADWDRAGPMPRNVWRRLGEAGLLCVDMAEEYGGAGADFLFSAAVIEEISRRGMAGLTTGVSVHSDIVAPYIAHLGTAAQKQHWLPRMASGEAAGAIAMTEPGAGSDLQGMRSVARRDGDAYLLSGAKTFITNGQHADVVIVAAKTDPSAGARGVTLFLVDTSLPGFSHGKTLEKLGQHANDTAELFFDEIRLPADAVLGGENTGFGHLMDELPRERLILAVGAVAAADGIIEQTREYVTTRKAFGQTLAQFQNTRFRLAEMYTDLELCRAFVSQCTRQYQAGELDATTGAMAKYAATEMQCRVADGCLQLFGGYGYIREYPVARAFIDARIQRIYGGTSEIMKELIARKLVGKA